MTEINKSLYFVRFPVTSYLEYVIVAHSGDQALKYAKRMYGDGITADRYGPLMSDENDAYIDGIEGDLEEFADVIAESAQNCIDIENEAIDRGL